MPKFRHIYSVQHQLEKNIAQTFAKSSHSTLVASGNLLGLSSTTSHFRGTLKPHEDLNLKNFPFQPLWLLERWVTRLTPRLEEIPVLSPIQAIKVLEQFKGGDHLIPPTAEEERP